MWRLLYLFLVWMAASFSLLLVWNLAPSTDGLSKLTFPKDLDDLRRLADSLEKYRDEHFWYTVILFACVYIYKQTFAIPGSFFLTNNIYEICMFLLLLATQRDRLLIFLLGARVFPFTPHWLLNICSPFLDVPLTTHAITVGLVEI
uniref:Transmembrane protein n=1 Tax=Heterorhabditis bacteriophora TaxID=37862 RepID=A0A1I7X4P0_HETBA